MKAKLVWIMLILSILITRADSSHLRNPASLKSVKFSDLSDVPDASVKGVMIDANFRLLFPKYQVQTKDKKLSNTK